MPISAAASTRAVRTKRSTRDEAKGRALPALFLCLQGFGTDGGGAALISPQKSPGCLDTLGAFRFGAVPRRS
jgi:hypothetical protein